MPAQSKTVRRGGRGSPPAFAGFGVPRRHYSPLGGGSLFGDGSYSGNIIGPPANARTADSNSGRGSASDFVIDLDLAIAAGTVVSGLWLWEWSSASSIVMGIMRRDATGSFTCVRRVAITPTASNAWQYTALASAFVVPSDGCLYCLGMVNSNGFVTTGSTRNTYTKAGAPTEGAQNAYAYASQAGPALGYTGQQVLQPLASYQPLSDVMPTMTGQTTSGFTVTDNGNVGAGYEAWRVFDGANGGINGPSIWRIAGATGRLYIQFDKPTAIGGYSMQTNTNSGPNAPTQWNLYGSMTGAWGAEKVLVDSRSVGAWTHGEKRTFLLPAPSAAYAYLMLDILACGEGSNNTIGEMEIFPAPIANCIVVTGAATVAPSAATRGGGVLCPNLLVDGGSLTLDAAAEGLSLVASGFLGVLGGGKIHVDAKALGGGVETDARRLFAPPARNKLSTRHQLYAQRQAALPSDGAMLFLSAPAVSIASGCVVSADGTSGNANGGRVCITHRDGYANAGTVRANGYGSGVAGIVTINKV